MRSIETNQALADERLVLLRPLEDVHLDLLDAIWQPVANSQVAWPVWDYVARKIYRQSPALPAAGSVLASLPTVPVGIQRINYGLVWRAQNSTIEPVADEQVGLSITGLLRLGERRPEALELGDLLATFIGYAANWERELEPDPSRAVELIQPLDTPLRELLARSQAVGHVPPLNVLEVLQREFAPLNLRWEGYGNGAIIVLRMALAPFHGVSTAREYVDRIAAQQPTGRPVDTASPMLVAQMLDYLSLVLLDHPGWPEERLVEAPDLRAAATLVLGVATDVEFRDRMSALTAVLGGLRVPQIPKDVVINRFDGIKPGSLQRLKYWLESNLTDPSSQSRAVQAVENLRSVVALRNEGQHPSNSQRSRAAAARQNLGMPELILDWSDAWNLVRARVAEACDVICQEVRLTRQGEY